ncbi:hypothetical protein MMAG44476_21822 [Mycolicibacterium mageritense DSM 44476 = CIP 104973]|jgi:hypothetical protein|uniref:Uncharacterized protein n=1 Tax=Mycolicibacterium canariasense TaxID=228230 RepID=A0A100WAG0_MYCCR|nr:MULTISPECIES: hypothetical protein [Mycolicibacterium]MCC9179553.1 hypothetical protein [Mycolicibacterium mageritense]MCV7211442.1 hypothetical protein [Mycolicibacterium canariasense]ORV10474.1 hypothetical protein AWB94_07185 [Mycolicibacterium canariasense]GAS94897.1 uncharacterized protein RMCC_1863 [Mycolicibacterium canariasense]
MSHPTYDEALTSLRRIGAAHADTAGQIAGLCSSTLQITCGALSPKLVYEGAMKRGLTVKEFATMMSTDPHAVSELQWL